MSGAHPPFPWPTDGSWSWPNWTQGFPHSPTSQPSSTSMPSTSSPTSVPSTSSPTSVPNTSVSTTTVTQNTPAPSTTATQHQSTTTGPNKSLIGAVVGGVLGGLILLSVVFAVFFIRRRQRRSRPEGSIVAPLVYDEGYVQPSDQKGRTEQGIREVNGLQNDLERNNEGRVLHSNRHSSEPETELRQQMELMNQRIQELETLGTPPSYSTARVNQYLSHLTNMGEAGRNSASGGTAL